MEQIDFFVCYSTDDEKIVKELVDALEKEGAKCWYAPRDAGMGRYTKAITTAIANAKIFLLCLSSNSAASDHVLNEVEIASNNNIRNKKEKVDRKIIIEPLWIEELDPDAPEFDEIMYHARTSNFIKPQDLTSASSIAQEVLLRNKDILKRADSSTKKKRTESKYFTNKKEEARLAKQNNLIRKFDADIYSEVFNSYEAPSILDVGCSNGNLLLDRLKDYSGSFQLIGVDKDPEMIKLAKEKNQKENLEFIACDVSNENFVNGLHDVMIQKGIDNFDIIHISMLLLHLERETTLLRRLRRLLKPGGTMIIKEVDDGINFAYPDETGEFERLYKMCEMDETAGNRQNGREIYHDLVNAGFENISLKRSGFSTIGLTDDEKETFWEMYFGFIFDDMQWMHKQYPEDVNIADEYEWYSENYEDIFDRFMKKDFAFSLGFQIYLAKR